MGTFAAFLVIILALSCLFAPTTANTPTLDSLTSRQDSVLGFEDCTTTEQCGEDRACVNIRSDNITLCPNDAGESTCQCLPLQLTSDECPGGASECLKTCKKSGDCDVERAVCAPVGVFESNNTVSRSACAQQCFGNDQCDEDELCSILPGDDLVNYRFCASEEQVNEREDLEEYVCVDARTLEHLPRMELVYEEHRKARVLCDGQGACATPGHVVRFHGKAMMMKSYCAEVGDCVKRVMLVNSPRYRRALRVQTRTEGLDFTAFAARFETRAEEQVLATAVHMGL